MGLIQKCCINSNYNVTTVYAALVHRIGLIAITERHPEASASTYSGKKDFGCKADLIQTPI